MRVNPRAFNYLLISSVSCSAATCLKCSKQTRQLYFWDVHKLRRWLSNFLILCEEQWTLFTGMRLMVCSCTVTGRVLHRAVYFAVCRLYTWHTVVETQTCHCGPDDARGGFTGNYDVSRRVSTEEEHLITRITFITIGLLEIFFLVTQ